MLHGMQNVTGSEPSTPPLWCLTTGGCPSR